MKTPHYTLVEYKTEHGLISAVTETSNPGIIVFGFTDHDSCIDFLRKKRQRRYLQDKETRDIPALPGRTGHDKELDAWYQDFLKEIDRHVTWSNVKVLHCIDRKEIDHCTITDTTELFCTRGSKGIVFNRYFHSTWGGSTSHISTLDGPAHRREITELIRKHKQTIVDYLILDKSFRN